MKIITRVAEQKDLPFIFSSWLKFLSTRFDYQTVNHKGEMSRKIFVGSPFCNMDKDLFYFRMNPYLQKIFDISTCTVAFEESDPESILGYCIHRYEGEITVISFIYVQGLFRRFGIATKLLEEIKTDSVVVTLTNERINHRRQKAGFVYDPFLDFKYIGGLVYG